jgi:bifunctional DNA-binding transcriptional regulator/antitoxin component of YhaV-PrlF toxin-antitoxin module
MNSDLIATTLGDINIVSIGDAADVPLTTVEPSIELNTTDSAGNETLNEMIEFIEVRNGTLILNEIAVTLPSHNVSLEPSSNGTSHTAENNTAIESTATVNSTDMMVNETGNATVPIRVRRDIGANETDFSNTTEIVESSHLNLSTEATSSAVTSLSNLLPNVSDSEILSTAVNSDLIATTLGDINMVSIGDVAAVPLTTVEPSIELNTTDSAGNETLIDWSAVEWYVR